MAVQRNQNQDNNVKLKPAEGWLNVYITHNGKDLKIGGIPLDNSKPLHARINAACSKTGDVSPIENYISMTWAAGGATDPSGLDLPF